MSYSQLKSLISFWQANIIRTLDRASPRRKSHIDADKLAVVNAWHRINCRTREALRRSFLSELIDGYEVHDSHSYRCFRYDSSMELLILNLK